MAERASTRRWHGLGPSGSDGDSGACRSVKVQTPMRRRISANSAHGTATSASWKTRYRPGARSGADFDQLLAQGRERPLLNLLRQGQRAQEVGEVVGQGVELEPHGVVAEGVAGQSRPTQRILALSARFPDLLGNLRFVHALAVQLENARHRRVHAARLLADHAVVLACHRGRRRPRLVWRGCLPLGPRARRPPEPETLAITPSPEKNGGRKIDRNDRAYRPRHTDPAWYADLATSRRPEGAATTRSTTFTSTLNRCAWPSGFTNR